MMKPGVGAYYRFKELFDKYSKEAGKEQYLILISSPPTRAPAIQDMLECAVVEEERFRLDQVSGIPAPPMATHRHVSFRQESAERITRASEEVVIPKGSKCAVCTKAFLRYHDAEIAAAAEALKRMGRADLIGNGKHHLIPAYQPLGSATARVRPTPGRVCRFEPSTQVCQVRPRPARRKSRGRP